MYSTAFKRTRQTLQFVAAQRGKDISEYDPRNLKDFANTLRSKQGKIVLIAGHSNTTPTLANMLLEAETYQPLPESEFGKIWFITLYRDKPGNVVVLNY